MRQAARPAPQKGPTTARPEPQVSWLVLSHVPASQGPLCDNHSPSPRRGSALCQQPFSRFGYLGLVLTTDDSAPRSAAILAASDARRRAGCSATMGPAGMLARLWR